MRTTHVRYASATICVAASTAALAATSLLSIDFEDEQVGPLGAPWIVVPPDSASTVELVDAGRHGHVRHLNADPEEGEFVVASTGFSSAQARIRTQVDVRPAAGASFIWTLTGAGSSIGARRIRLQRDPGTEMLTAQTSPSGNTDCGPLPSAAWTRITLVVDARRFPHTFDVRIAGMPTACTGIETGLGPPFDGVRVMDASDVGWGGEVRFDNIEVAAR